MVQDAGWEDRPRARRGLWAVLAVVVVIATAVATALTGWRAEWRAEQSPGQGLLSVGEQGPGRPAPPRRPAGDLEPGDVIRGRWMAMAPAPLSGRSMATMTWTGREAVIWGGMAGEPQADGASYDTTRDSWTMLPESPLSPRFGHAAAWTGREVVVAGGSSAVVPGGDLVVDLVDAAAFNPRTGRWRMLPPLPFPIGPGQLFAGGGRLFAISSVANPVWIATLEPGASRWADLPVARLGPPGSAVAGMVHDELVIWSRHGRGAGVAIDITDPARSRPLQRAPQPLTDIADCCVLVAGHSGTGVDVVVYDRDRDVWRPLGEGTHAELAVSPDLVFLVRLYGNSGALALRTGTPLRLPPHPVAPRYGAAVTWAGDRVLAWGGEHEDGGFAAEGLAFVMPRP